MMRALGHDFVLRCNICIGFAARGKDSTTFLKWSYGSHHTCLITRIASTWNSLLGWKTIRWLNLSLKPRPILRVVNSGEKFGLVASDDATSFGSLIDIEKEEPCEELLDLIPDDSDEVKHILHDLNIDSALLSAPAMTPVSHLKGTGTAPSWQDMASESTYPVSCTSCTSVCHLPCSPCLHA